jgi:hypothetical protein
VRRSRAGGTRSGRRGRKRQCDALSSISTRCTSRRGREETASDALIIPPGPPPPTPPAAPRAPRRRRHAEAARRPLLVLHERRPPLALGDVRQRQPHVLALDAHGHQPKPVPVVERPVQEPQLGLGGQEAQEGEGGAEVAGAAIAFKLRRDHRSPCRLAVVQVEGSRSVSSVTAREHSAAWRRPRGAVLEGQARRRWGCRRRSSGMTGARPVFSARARRAPSRVSWSCSS